MVELEPAIFTVVWAAGEDWGELVAAGLAEDVVLSTVDFEHPLKFSNKMPKIRVFAK
jgi:hypothetical protein